MCSSTSTCSIVVLVTCTSTYTQIVTSAALDEVDEELAVGRVAHVILFLTKSLNQAVWMESFLLYDPFLAQPVTLMSCKAVSTL
jgi:hypothetical protein